MMDKDMVSIIIPCYKQSQYLDEALEAVFIQEYSNWECIIVNDGSPDDTEKVASAWLKRDKRFKYFYQENMGLSSARNLGIAHSSGEFILPLDADDKISGEYLQLAFEEFQKDPELKLVYCRAKKFGAVNDFWKLEAFSLEGLSKKNMIFSSAVFKKEDWIKVGGYDPNMKYGWEDWEFWIAILKTGGKVVQLDILGFYYRIKGNSMISNIDHRRAKKLLEYISVKHSDFFVHYLGSFHELLHQKDKQRKAFEQKIRSEKFVIDLFCKRFFGFTIFRNKIR